MAFRFRTASLPVRCVLVALSGLAYAAAFPPLGWRWLIVPGVGGLLLALQGLRGSQARGIGFSHGMVAYGVGLPWLWLLFGPFAMALWAILAAFTAAFAWMQSRAEDRGVSGGAFALFTVANWCGWEFIRAELFPLKFPWMTAGLAMGPNDLLPLVGVYGAGAMMVSVAVCMVRRRWWLAAGISLVVVFASHGLTKWAVPVGDEPDLIAVAGLQFESTSFGHFLKTTHELPDRVGDMTTPAKIQHVVWPEYSVPYDIRASKRDWQALIDLCRERDITLTLGTQTRPKERLEWFNTAVTLDATGALGEHHKAHPVHFFDDGTPGTTALPVTTSHGRIGTPICFDCDYEGVVRRMTAAGAEVFIVPMMDAESWSKWQHDQHAELFRIRACENARWFFVCGTSGVSQVIDSEGNVRAKLEAMEQGLLTGFVRRRSELTFYTRYGWLAPWGLLTSAAACWIVLLLPRRAAKDSAS